MSNNYDELDAQIGGAGGETPTSRGLGKIQHKEILGGHSDLDDADKKSMEEFMARTKSDRAARTESINIGDGWVPVNREEMGIRSMFYPQEWEFYIKPATVSAIKNWTAVDEERTDLVNNVFNEIIRTSVKIDTHGVGQGGWGQINSWDRFWFILKVREITFVHGESKVQFEDACSECDQDITYTLTSDSLFYEFPDEELVEKYWDNGEWNIDPAEYDVQHEPITLYTPKLGKDDAIIEWATARARMKKKVDENFIKFLVWMMPKPAKDMQVLDRQIDKYYKEYKSWSVEMYEFMEDVVRNITINPSENLRVICPHCGQEATSTVQFPNGLKVLFKSETKAKKFGSR